LAQNLRSYVDLCIIDRLNNPYFCGRKFFTTNKTIHYD